MITYDLLHYLSSILAARAILSGRIDDMDRTRAIRPPAVHEQRVRAMRENVYRGRTQSGSDVLAS